MHYSLKNVCWIVAGLLLWALPLPAQLQIGNKLKLNLNGTLSSSYSGTFGEGEQSQHSLSMGGNSAMTGSYFSPNFLSFTARPYYNRSQANSTFQSIGNTSGYDNSATIFGGTHFPGSINYSKSYNSTGQFGIPGAAGLVTHGDARQIGVGWSALFPGLPTLSVNYSTESDQSSLYGTDQTNHSSTRTLSMMSDYQLFGFALSGGYLRLSNTMNFPDFIAGTKQESSGSSNSIQLSASHRFPLNGSFGAGFSRSSFGYGYQTAGLSGSTQNTNSTGTTNSITTNLSIHPLKRLGLSFGSNYSDNLAGSIAQAFISAGGAPPQSSLSSSRALLLSSNAFISILPSLSVQAGVSRQQQYFKGQSFGMTQISAGTSYYYRRPLFGFLAFSLGMTDSATKQGNTGAGLNASVSLSRKIHRFDFGAGYGYSQYLQTLGAMSTSSSNSYSSSVARKINDHTFWNVSLGGGHSGLTTRGSSNRSEMMSTGFSYRGYALNGTYSQSAGTSLLTSRGLVATPVGLPPELLSPDAIVLFNAHSVSGSLSASMFKKLLITGAYSTGRGTAISPILSSASSNEMLTGYLRYPVRRLDVTAGFTRFSQGISTVGVPRVVNSFSFGISRWFNVF